MNTIKSVSKTSQKDKPKLDVKIPDPELDDIITTFKSIVKICESLITDSINSTDPKNNYTSLTNIFNKINNAISFNTFINNIFSYASCDEKLQDDKEVEPYNNYYKSLLYVDGKHPFLVKSDIINIKIDNIFNNLNRFIKLCYKYNNTNGNKMSNKLHKLPVQDINNYITKTNALLKVKIPYLLKNSKTSKKKSIEDSTKPINIEHNVKKTRNIKVETLSHDQIKYNYDTESIDITKNKKTKKQIDTDEESDNSKSKYSDRGSVSSLSNKNNNKQKLPINDSEYDSNSDEDNNTSRVQSDSD